MKSQPSCRDCRLLMIEVEGLIDGWKVVELTIDQDSRPAAMFANIGRIVRDDDHRTVSALDEKLVVTLLMETGVPDRDDFIDQKAVELNYHRECEGEPSAHAG